MAYPFSTTSTGIDLNRFDDDADTVADADDKRRLW